MAKVHKKAKELIDTLPALSAGNTEKILSAIDQFSEAGDDSNKYAAALMRAFLEREWAVEGRKVLTAEEFKNFIGGEYEVTYYGAREPQWPYEPKNSYWAKKLAEEGRDYLQTQWDDPSLTKIYFPDGLRATRLFYSVINLCLKDVFEKGAGKLSRATAALLFDDNSFPLPPTDPKIPWALNYQDESGKPLAGYKQPYCTLIGQEKLQAAMERYGIHPFKKYSVLEVGGFKALDEDSFSLPEPLCFRWYNTIPLEDFPLIRQFEKYQNCAGKEFQEAGKGRATLAKQSELLGDARFDFFISSLVMTPLSGVGHYPDWAKGMEIGGDHPADVKGTLDLLALGANALKPSGRMVHQDGDLVDSAEKDSRQFTGGINGVLWNSDWEKKPSFADFCGLEFERDTGLFRKIDDRQVDGAALRDGFLKGLSWEEYQAQLSLKKTRDKATDTAKNLPDH